MIQIARPPRQIHDVPAPNLRLLEPPRRASERHVPGATLDSTELYLDSTRPYSDSTRPYPDSTRPYCAHHGGSNHLFNCLDLYHTSPDSSEWRDKLMA